MSAKKTQALSILYIGFDSVCYEKLEDKFRVTFNSLHWIRSAWTT